jgi:hypothetical protein
VEEAEARDRVRTLDQNRLAFYHKYWPHEGLAPEMFHITVNASAMSEEQMVDCILPLLQLRSQTEPGGGDWPCPVGGRAEDAEGRKKRAVCRADFARLLEGEKRFFG